MRTTLLAMALAFALSEPSSAAWRRPVEAPVARAFAYSPAAPFRAGAHRGVDLAAPPGTRVRAACSGAVVTARPGAALGAGVVTLRCGRWRVTALGLATLAVRVGDRVRTGASLGRLGTLPGHTGLHLGVRRASDRFAYVDPLPFLRATPPPAPAVPRAGPPRRRAAPPRAAPAPRAVAPPRAAPAPRAARPGGSGGEVRVPVGGVAPWPAWVGLGLVALGAVGGGVRVRVRRARARAAVAVPSAP